MASPSIRLLPIAASALAYVGADRFLSRLGGPSQPRARRWMQRWSRDTCRRLGIRVEVEGPVPTGPCVFIANHRSYLDIAVLSATLGATFLSRDDISRWPVIGRAAKAIGAVFVDRADPYGRASAARQLWRRVRRQSIIIFPEGTTRGEPRPGDFPEGLFRLLHRVGGTVIPVTLRYDSRRPYWVEDISVGEHLRRLVETAEPSRCVVHLGEPVVSLPTAAALAAAVHEAVTRPIEEFGEFVAA